ncbi:hypothetical protein KY290_034191 [Solanum tuberosum]|uniref:Uncharacterized protein n=1 Tax=Solanum tuberosum TaxID=4113 RepID=A0ABQ7U308_SOLTU|nr:hypothetical protein KY289_033575 [Solanum tuberosum]KAH0741148.1 hypothetical protein KY290_034191 [Solanum tuberosum]
MEISSEGDTHDASDSKSPIDLNLPLPVRMNGGDCQHLSIRNPSKQLPTEEVPEHKWCWYADYTHKIGVDGSVGDKIGPPSLRLRKETDQTSKGGDANLRKHSRWDLQEDITNVAKCRKTQKVRLMTELLSGKYNLGRSSMNAKLFSANNMPMELNRVAPPMDKGMRMAVSQSENELYQEKLRQTLKSFTNGQKHAKNDPTQRKNIPNWPTILKDNKSCEPLKVNGVGSSESLQKEVISSGRQSNLVQLDQSRRNSFINLNPIIDLSHSSILQRNQRSSKVTEKRASTYMSPTSNMRMFRNWKEVNYPQTQNGVFPWRNLGSTNFNPSYANDGLLRSNTATTQVKDRTTKLPNSLQVSSPVPTRGGSHNIEISSPVKFSIAQNTTFQPYDLHENHKFGKVVISSVEKGKTVSDLKSTNSMRAEDKSIKGVRSLNPFSNEGTLATQLSRYQERHLTPYNIHPPFLLHENPCIYNGSFLPHHQLKESSGIYMSDFPEIQSSRQHVSCFKDQSVSLGLQQKKRKAHALEKLGRRKLQQSTSSSGILHIARNSDSKIDMMQDDNISKTLDMRGYYTPTTILPVIRISKENPPCLFNQNPVDIVDADDERYFRTIEDQRIRDKSSLWENWS